MLKRAREQPVAEDKFKRNNRSERLKIMGQIAEQSEKLLQGMATNPEAFSAAYKNADPLSLTPIVHELMRRMVRNPTSLIETQLTIWQKYIELWQTTSKRLLSSSIRSTTKPVPGDRRFNAVDWDDEAIFGIIKQSHLLTARWMTQFVDGFDELDDKAREKIDFYTRQFINMMAASEFIAKNPDIVRATLASGGDILLHGFNRLLADLDRHPARADGNAFELGKNLATTPGKVVFQNDVMQLIQYAPSTNTVHRRPLLIIPAWINKFYLLDVSPEKSFVKFAVDQGLTVFIISWVDPDDGGAEKAFEDYMSDGLLAALDAIEQATGDAEINTIGCSLGGTLLIATLAYMSSKQDKRIKSATLLNTLTDFEEPGNLGMFLDEEQLFSTDQPKADDCLLNEVELSTTFSMLRANDLIWSFVIDTYQSEDASFPFDLFYWNADTTNLPFALHRDYLRHFHQENSLVRPGALALDDVAIDLRKIRTPTYMLSAVEDHIAPWMSTYAATQLLRGGITFVLAGSGHISGVINPAKSEKYGYRLNDSLPADPKDWLEDSIEMEGSWWPHWMAWITDYSGGKVKARQPGEGGKLDVIEDGPGHYARGKTN